MKIKRITALILTCIMASSTVAYADAPDGVDNLIVETAAPEIGSMEIEPVEEPADIMKLLRHPMILISLKKLMSRMKTLQITLRMNLLISISIQNPFLTKSLSAPQPTAVSTNHAFPKSGS